MCFKTPIFFSLVKTQLYHTLYFIYISFFLSPLHQIFFSLLPSSPAFFLLQFLSFHCLPNSTPHNKDKQKTNHINQTQPPFVTQIKSTNQSHNQTHKSTHNQTHKSKPNPLRGGLSDPNHSQTMIEIEVFLHTASSPYTASPHPQPQTHNRVSYSLPQCSKISL